MIRNVKEEDYYYIYPRVNDWWGGRQLAHLLPKLFFQHFQNTSFVVEETDATSGAKKIIAFIIGFISQTDSTRAYIHFVGVDPDHRKKQLGSKLYELFLDTVRAKGVKTVNSITSLVNKTSISFHTAVGFSCLGSAISEDGVAYYPNYEDGKDCVVFEKKI